MNHQIQRGIVHNNSGVPVTASILDYDDDSYPFVSLGDQPWTTLTAEQARQLAADLLAAADELDSDD